MHATRARLPQKRTRKPAAGKKPSVRTTASLAAASAALPEGVASLAAHRAQQTPRALPSVEVFALVEWFAPARESWRRGELELRRSACMPMAAAWAADGTLALTELPGQGDPLLLDAPTIAALRSGTARAVVRALPGMRVTLTLDDLAPALPPVRRPAEILAFPKR